MVGITTLAAFACILTRSSAALVGAVANISWVDSSVPAVSQNPAEARCIVSSHFAFAYGGRSPTEGTQDISWEAKSPVAFADSPGLVPCCRTEPVGTALADAHPPNRGCPSKPEHTITLCHAANPASHGIANADAAFTVVSLVAVIASAAKQSPSSCALRWRLPRRFAPNKKPGSLSRHFHRHGRACPGHRSWHCASTDGRHRPAMTVKAGFIQGGSAEGRCRNSQ